MTPLCLCYALSYLRLRFPLIERIIFALQAPAAALS